MTFPYLNNDLRLVIVRPCMTATCIEVFPVRYKPKQLVIMSLIPVYALGLLLVG